MNSVIRNGTNPCLRKRRAGTSRSKISPLRWTFSSWPRMPTRGRCRDLERGSRPVSPAESKRVGFWGGFYVRVGKRDTGCRGSGLAGAAQAGSESREATGTAMSGPALSGSPSGAGRSKRKQAPPSGPSSIQIVPPCASTASRQKVRPSPRLAATPALRSLGLLRTSRRPVSRCSSAMPGALVGHGELDALLAQAGRDAPPGRPSASVPARWRAGCPRPAAAVRGRHRPGPARSAASSRRTPLPCRRLGLGQRGSQQLGRVQSLQRRHQATLLQPLHVEQVEDHLQHPTPRPVCCAEPGSAALPRPRNSSRSRLPRIAASGLFRSCTSVWARVRLSCSSSLRAASAVRAASSSTAAARTRSRRPHLGQELLAPHRLGHEIVGTGVQTLHAIRRAVQRRDQHDLAEAGPRVRLELAADLVAGHPRHHHVEQDHVRQLLARQGQAGRSVPGRLHAVPLGRKVTFEQTAAPIVVIDDQDSGRGLAIGDPCQA